MNPTALFFVIGFAAALVGFLSGFVVWRRCDEHPLLAAALRRYAERSLACWEGPDADDAALTMLRAADLLEADR